MSWMVGSSTCSVSCGLTVTIQRFVEKNENNLGHHVRYIQKNPYLFLIAPLSIGARSLYPLTSTNVMRRTSGFSLFYWLTTPLGNCFIYRRRRRQRDRDPFYLLGFQPKFFLEDFDGLLARGLRSKFSICPTS